MPKSSVSEAEKQRLYDIYRQFLNSKWSVTEQVYLSFSLIGLVWILKFIDSFLRECVVLEEV